MGETEQGVQARLELLGTVALLTVTAVMKVIDTQHPELTEEQRLKLSQVRDDVTRALEAIEAHLETEEPGEEGVDLTGLRDRLAKILESLGTRADPPALPA